MHSNLHTLTLVICVAALLNSCGDHQHSNDDPHLHDATEWPARAQTIYTDSHQLFFENEYAVVGRATGFALHLSNLDDGSPRTSGAISVHFNSVDEQINLTIDSPARPGIYLCDIVFPTHAEYEWSVNIDNAIISLDSIGVYQDEHTALHASEGIDDGSSGITMLKEQQWPIRLITEEVHINNLAHQIPATARVSACNTHTANVFSPLTGNLSAPPTGERVVLGQQVKAGELLAVLRVPLLGSELNAWQAAQANAIGEATRAAAELQQISVKFERVKQLHAKQAKSARELEEAQYQFARASAADTAARAAVASYANAKPGSSMDLELIAPISGQIIAAPTARGEWTSAGTELFQLQDLSQLHVAVRVPEADLPSLSNDLSAYIVHPEGGERIELPGADGEILLAGQKVDPQTHAAEVLYEIPNPGWLRSGMTLTAQLATGEAHSVMSIPSTAIVDDSGISVAFVQTGGESFERRALRLGHRDGQRVEVLEGLNLGERVVISGAYVVHLTALSGAIPEHSH
ncbi:MAG: efflux RND transporter periplasmic adaptor subunit [Planctomycetes bacterium]|nr:efflux RND transporter periplasmic adaptor subunit [Planctomycetota bacterium]